VLGFQFVVATRQVEPPQKRRSRGKNERNVQRSFSPVIFRAK
jgi:hypothetical protein